MIDNISGIKINCLKLSREVERYLWVEKEIINDNGPSTYSYHE